MLLTVGGVFLLFFGIYFILLPFCQRKNMVELYLLEDPERGRSWKAQQLPNPVVLEVDYQPDETFILDYVYGHLASPSMRNYHCAAHLIDNGVFTKMPVEAVKNVKID